MGENELYQIAFHFPAEGTGAMSYGREESV